MHETFGVFWKSKHPVRRLNKLAANEVTSVAHAEIVEHMDRAENAHRHHITPELVGRIVRCAKKDKKFLKKRLEKEKKYSELVEKIKNQFLMHAGNSTNPLTVSKI